MVLFYKQIIIFKNKKGNLSLPLNKSVPHFKTNL